MADIAGTLGLNRSTATAVLAALETADWAQRRPDRGYVIGPGLLGVADAVHRRPLAEALRADLHDFAVRVGCGVSLVHVAHAHLTFLATAGAQAPAPMRDPLADLLELVRATGIGVWRTAEDQGPLVEVLREVVAVLSEHDGYGPLRAQVLDQLAPLSRVPYTAAELESEAELPLSYLSAPVFDASGRARYELDMGPLRSAVSRAERDADIAELRAAADKMNTYRCLVAHGGHTLLTAWCFVPWAGLRLRRRQSWTAPADRGRHHDSLAPRSGPNA